MSESDKYEVLEKIGHGSFGIIRKVKRRSDGQILCRKEINYVRMSTKEREQLHAEFSILSSLRHPNIVGYYHREHLKSTQDLHLYMEYCGNGDLGRVIRDLKAKKQYAEESFVWSMFSQLLTALYRCHYGVDPPEVGSNVLGLGNSAKPRHVPSGVTILHRDLKPENVFLGADNSVKLGDFGLSKVMQSHDFASTYVGTPFYMSPEISAAERYTLKSDIWSLGCIIYELCAREPPFNAKTHLQLIQKIREGKVAPIPGVYSAELMGVIKDCLKVNPDRRPDTATLLNLPVVKLMRKEKEVVELARIVKSKDEAVTQRLQEAEEKLRKIEADGMQTKADMEVTIRREWEVKARLEIDRIVQLEIEKLQKRFESEVQATVEIELAKRLPPAVAPSLKSSSPPMPPNDIPQSSVSTCEDGEFPSTTDLTEYSTDSPEPAKASKRSTRTPFTRAKTMFVGTPMDIEMAEPSPMSIASLSLSPRRHGGARALESRNIFGTGETMQQWRQMLATSDSDSEDDLQVPPSPTQPKSKPINVPKALNCPPSDILQKAAQFQKVVGQANFFVAGSPKPHTGPNFSNATSHTNLQTTGSNGALRERSPSPSRRPTKIPSCTALGKDRPASPERKPSIKKVTVSNPESVDLGKLAIKNNMAIKVNAPPRGRTLVELAQARAGGRPVGANIDDISPKGKKFADCLVSREVATWDPELDEMPSPFLDKKRAPIHRA